MSLTATQLTLDDVFSPDGRLSLSLKGYEARSEQLEMAKDVYKAFTDNAHALIEAQTGTGKSLAYLIPSILWALKHDEQIVISTNTIALQEQLIEKDLPCALKALGMQISYVRAIGASNYLCLRRLDEALDDRSLYSEDSNEALVAFEQFSRYTVRGSKSDLPFLPQSKDWQKVFVDLHSCNGPNCPHHQKCFFLKAKKEMQDARIIVVNHHLLFSDLQVRLQSNNFSAMAVLPSYKRLIIDEAHHIEEIAAYHFAKKVHQGELEKLLTDVQGLFSHFLMQTVYPDTLDAYQVSKTTSVQGASFFEALKRFLFEKSSEQQVRILPAHRKLEFWDGTLIPKYKAFHESAQTLISRLEKVEQALVDYAKENKQHTESLRLSLSAVKTKFFLQIQNLHHFFNDISNDFVYWIEKQGHGQNIQLYSASLDVAKMLKASLFSLSSSIVFCSATLSSNQNFNFISSRLGVGKSEEKEVIEKLYPSPFDYSKQVLLGVPTDLPSPKDPNFQEASLHAIKTCVRISRGGAFVLFTSYDALQKSYDALSCDFKELGLNPMKQGDDHRHALISNFKKTPRSILFATDSFWEGVDIVGEALSLVIITKLPFHVPTEPLSQARSEKLTNEGKNAFFEYSLPKATIKLKQAFGRLIRHKNDYGACICLDVRLIKSGYGAILRKSFPSCQEVFEPLDELKKQMVTFYKKRKLGA